MQYKEVNKLTSTEDLISVAPNKVFRKWIFSRVMVHIKRHNIMYMQGGADAHQGNQRIITYQL